MLHLHVHCKFGTETLCNTLHIHIFCMNIVCMLMRFECQHTVASTCEDDAIEYYYHIEETTVDSAHSHTRTTHTHTIWMSKRKKKGECYFWIYRYSQPTQCYSKIFVLFPKVHSSFPLILSLPYLWCLSSVATEEFIKNYFPFILSFNYYPLVLMCACEFCLPICIC